MTILRKKIMEKISKTLTNRNENCAGFKKNLETLIASNMAQFVLLIWPSFDELNNPLVLVYGYLNGNTDVLLSTNTLLWVSWVSLPILKLYLLPYCRIYAQ